MEYELKNIQDDEFNPISIISLQAPSFVEVEGLTFKFKPTQPYFQIGVFSVKGLLTDSRLTLPFKFNVLVTNDPPVFKSIPEIQKVEIYTIKEYRLPDIIELEKLPV